MPPLIAYIDPGSGSMLLQVILISIAGAAMTIRLLWQRLRYRVGLGARPQEPAAGPGKRAA